MGSASTAALLQIREARRYWDSRASGKLGNLAQFFIYHVTATNRIGGVSPQGRRADIADPPENPMHILEDNEDILEKVQGISRKIFREILTLDRISNNIQLRVGEPSIPAPPIATQKFHQPRREVTNAQILNALQAALSPKLAEKYDSNMRETLRAAMRVDPSPWAELKQYGMDAFQRQARTEATKMLKRLRTVGLVLVERGELENLAPTVESKKGKNWINEALQKRAYQDKYAQEHISQVICAITHLVGSDPHATCSVTGQKATEP
jgi:hypothetical protein